MRKRPLASWPHQPASRGRSSAARVALVHEAAADRAGAGIQVLVAAPDGEVGAGVVQRERHVADRVREVEADAAAVALRGRRDTRRGRAARRSDTARRAAARARCCRLALRAAPRSARGRARSSPSRGPISSRARARIEPVPAHLRLDGVAIRGERVALDEDLVALARRAGRTSRASGAGSPSACSSRRLRRAARRRARRACGANCT